ncbi:MAG: hypothetical protein AB1Z98_19900, partial [Nannocystaceae bacterium]
MEPRAALESGRPAATHRLAAAALGLAVGLGSPSAAGAPSPAEAPAPPQASRAGPPRDPNEQPPLPPPNGQPAPDSLRRDVDHTSDRSRRWRAVLTAAPLYASFRMPFLGRPAVPVRGVGFGLFAQFPVYKPFGVRISASHSVHPVRDEFTRPEDEAPVRIARRGAIQATHAGASATFSMDIGRVRPTLDAGVGGMWIRSPESVQDGQLGGACLDGGVCDTGLACGASDVCEAGVTPQVHGGFALDVMIGDRFAVG